jgi:hypothetical protein
MHRYILMVAFESEHPLSEDIALHNLYVGKHFAGEMNIDILHARWVDMDKVDTAGSPEGVPLDYEDGGPGSGVEGG